MSKLFELRGKLPRPTYLLIEIIGLIVLLLLWQLIASMSTKVEQEVPSEQFKPYFQTTTDTEFDSPYVFLYDKATINGDELDPLFRDLATEGKPLLLFTQQADRQTIQSKASQYPDLQLIAVQTTVQGAEKTDLLNKIGDFSGSSIITEDFFEEGEEVDLGVNFTGQVDAASITDGGLSLGIDKDLISNSILPSPVEVVTSFKELFQKDRLVENTLFSLILNLSGYLIALIIAIPLGFLIGLFPFFRALFSRNVDALRFVPLTAVTGLFMAWFGISITMKVAFLAFGIFVYLLPVVVQRIDEVEKVYVQTAYTLGASSWQQIVTVFIPAVISRISDDIRVLVAISWTYIIVAEMVNASEGGIGALAYKSARQSQIDKVFAILLVIILIGFIQDKVFKLLDRLFFPHKYQVK